MLKHTESVCELLAQFELHSWLDNEMIRAHCHKETTSPRRRRVLEVNQWLALCGVTALALVHLCARWLHSRTGLAVESVRAEHSIHVSFKGGCDGAGSIFTTGGKKKKFTAVNFVFARKYEQCSVHDVVMSSRWSKFNTWTESLCSVFFPLLLWMARVASVSVARELTNMMLYRLSVDLLLIFSLVWDYFSGNLRH